MTDTYITDHGPVRVSPAEAQTLSTAVVIKTVYSGRLFGKPETARMALAKAEAIKHACERFARFRLELNQE